MWRLNGHSSFIRSREGSSRASGLGRDCGSLLTSAFSIWSMDLLSGHLVSVSLVPRHDSGHSVNHSCPSCAHLSCLRFCSAFSKRLCLSAGEVFRGRAWGNLGVLFCFSSCARASRRLSSRPGVEIPPSTFIWDNQPL